LAPALEGQGIAVETPPVRIPSERVVSWRIRAAGNVSGSVVLRIPGVNEVKTVQIGSGLHYLSRRRVASLLGWLYYPGEPRLPAGAVQWIEIRYPAASLDIFGWGVHWLIWFSMVCIFTMFAFRKRFGVTF